MLLRSLLCSLLAIVMRQYVAKHISAKLVASITKCFLSQYNCCSIGNCLKCLYDLFESPWTVKLATHKRPSGLRTARSDGRRNSQHFCSPSWRQSGRIVCRGDSRNTKLTWKTLSCDAFLIDGPSWRAMCRGNSLEGQMMTCNTTLFITRHTKRHLKFTNIFRSQFANQPHGNPSVGRLHADSRFFPTISLHIYDDSASAVRCSIKLT